MENYTKISLRRKQTGTKMCENHKGGVLYFTFPHLEREEGFLHACSSRFGGVSEGMFSQMNLSFTRGDDPECVRENYRRIAAAVGFDTDWMVFSYQTHTVNVRVVTAEDRGKGFARERDYTDVDGLVTDVPGLVLTTFYADCVPLFFLDPVRRAVGLSHSGWRGTVNDIAGATVRTMQEQYGTKPEDVLAAIGPSICQDCYEVSEDVVEEFRAHYPEELWPELFERQDCYKARKINSGTSGDCRQAPHWPGDDQEKNSYPADTPVKKPYLAGNTAKYQLDLREACRRNMSRAGILPEHIEVTDLCTCCNPDVLFSHRASGGRRGNLAAFLGIRA